MRNTQIQLRHMGRSPSLTARILDLAEKLEMKNSRITSCRVAVEADNKRAGGAKTYEVRVDVSVAGAPDCVVDRHHDSNAYAAVRDAFAALERQLEPLHPRH